MEPTRTELLCLKHPDPQDSGDDEHGMPSMESPDDLPDNTSIAPPQKIAQNESIPSVSSSNITPLSKNSDTDADAGASTTQKCIAASHATKSHGPSMKIRGTHCTLLLLG